jgi:hypothetical protein
MRIRIHNNNFQYQKSKNLQHFQTFANFSSPYLNIENIDIVGFCLLMNFYIADGAMFTVQLDTSSMLYTSTEHFQKYHSFTQKANLI